LRRVAAQRWSCDVARMQSFVPWMVGALACGALVMGCGGGDSWQPAEVPASTLVAPPPIPGQGKSEADAFFDDDEPAAAPDPKPAPPVEPPAASADPAALPAPPVSAGPPAAKAPAKAPAAKPKAPAPLPK
jgi:hypothetical protein